jgi:hypothetical protein
VISGIKGVASGSCKMPGKSLKGTWIGSLLSLAVYTGLKS